MKVVSEPQQIIARYSTRKVMLWVVGVGVFSCAILAYGASHGWRIPSGRYGGLFPIAVVASIAGLAVGAAMVLNLVLARGVAIARSGDEFLLYYPLRWRRLAPASSVVVSARPAMVETPAYGSIFRFSPLVAEQVTLSRPGKPDLSFRTGLLCEPAAVIAERMRTGAGYA